MRIIASSPSLEIKIINYLQLNAACSVKVDKPPRAMQAAAAALPSPVSFRARFISQLGCPKRVLSPWLYTGGKVWVGKG